MTEKPRFVYVTYIASTLDKVFAALTDPKTSARYWFNITAECNFKPGSPWRLKFEDGRTADTGEILESDPPRRLVIRWRNEFKPELKAEGYSRCTMEIEMADYYPDFGGKAAKLTMTHDGFGDGSAVFPKISVGWPSILSSLKSLLETGKELPPFWTGDYDKK